jgi:alpha/beta superfamily hydrolase
MLSKSRHGGRQPVRAIRGCLIPWSIRLKIAAGEVELEARLWEPHGVSPLGAALCCHPHPLYGGTMNNRVIYRAAKGAVEAGVSALRFNFRGVGASSGQYGFGAGEQKDAEALLGWLGERYPNLPLALVGFSFGAWVGLSAASQHPSVRALVGLGLPLAHYDFDFLVANDKPSLYIVGTKDEFCPQGEMEAFALRLPATSSVVWVEGADHFFTGWIDIVQSRVRDFLGGPWKGPQS